MKAISAKLKTCKNPDCKGKFVPSRTFQSGCCTGCEIIIAKEKLAAKPIKQRTSFVVSARSSGKSKTYPQLVADTQHAFNAYIRARDFDKPCVSCGNPNPPFIDGVQWDCGHFRTVGAHPELRLNPDNAHKQCCVCNRGMGAPDVMARFELELLRRIGPARLAELKGPHDPAKLTRDRLYALKKALLSSAREMVKARESSA